MSSVAAHPGNSCSGHRVTDGDGRTLQAVFCEDHTCPAQEGTAGWPLILRDSVWLLHREEPGPGVTRRCPAWIHRAQGWSTAAAAAPVTGKAMGNPRGATPALLWGQGHCSVTQLLLTAQSWISDSAAWEATGSSSAQTSFPVTSNDSRACIKIFSL